MALVHPAPRAAYYRQADLGSFGPRAMAAQHYEHGLALSCPGGQTTGYVWAYRPRRAGENDIHSTDQSGRHLRPCRPRVRDESEVAEVYTKLRHTEHTGIGNSHRSAPRPDRRGGSEE